MQYLLPRPLAPPMSRLVSDILPAILVLRLQTLGLSEKLGVLNVDVVYSDLISEYREGNTCNRQNTLIRNTK
jgi:hypothetical protein